MTEKLVASVDVVEMTALDGKTYKVPMFTATPAAAEKVRNADTLTKIALFTRIAREAQHKAGLPASPVSRWPLPDYVDGVQTRWVPAAPRPVRTRLVGVLRGRRRTRRVWRRVGQRGPPSSRSSEDDDPHEHVDKLAADLLGRSR